jgi:hypothetical protein
MRVGRGSRPLTYRQSIVRVSLATLPVAAISLADAFIIIGYVPGLTTLFWTLFWVCASGWLVLLFLAGALARRATGSVPAGAGAGLVVGLISSLVYLVIGSTLHTLLHPSTGFVVCDPPCVPPTPSFALVANEIITFLPLSGISMVLGGGCGLLGGMLARLLHWLRCSQSSSALLR